MFIDNTDQEATVTTYSIAAVIAVIGIAGASNAQQSQPTFASATRLLRAVERIDPPFDTPAKQRAVVACRNAHVALWRGGLEARIVRASSDAPAAPRDLDAFWGLAYCTEQTQYVEESGSLEQRAAQRTALVYYTRYQAIEHRDPTVIGSGEQVSRMSYTYLAVAELQDAVAVQEPEPQRDPVVSVRPETQENKFPMLRSAILDGFDRIAREEYAECYAWFHSLILSRDLEDRLKRHLEGEDIAFTPNDLDIMLGNARCAEGTLATVDGGATALQDRMVEAAHYYARYASLERRRDHEQDVQDADARSRAIYEQYAAMSDHAIAVEHGRARPTPAHREPVTTLMPPRDPQEQYTDALVGANSMLALGYLQHAYTNYDILTVNPIGKDSPDVAWGMAKTTELSCASIDDDALRLHWLGVARKWYARYVDIERRPEHIQGAEARVTRARIAHGELERRIAALEEKVAAQERLRAAAAAAVSRGPLDGAGAGDGATNVSVAAGAIPDDGGSQDAQPPATTTAGAALGNDSPPPQQPPAASSPTRMQAGGASPPAVPPAIVAFQRAHPEYTLAELLCFTRYKMCRERMEIRHGFFYFFYDQFPPHGTQCPP